MAFANKNDVVAGRKPAPTPADCDVTMPAFTQACVAADSALNNVGAIGILPAGYLPKFAAVDSISGLGGTAAVSVGVLNAAGTDLSTDAADGGAAWLTAQAVGTSAAGALTRSLAMAKVQRSTKDRILAVKFTTAGSAAGDLTVNLAYSAN